MVSSSSNGRLCDDVMGAFFWRRYLEEGHEAAARREALGSFGEVFSLPNMENEGHANLSVEVYVAMEQPPAWKKIRTLL